MMGKEIWCMRLPLSEDIVLKLTILINSVHGLKHKDDHKRHGIKTFVCKPIGLYRLGLVQIVFVCMCNLAR